MASRVLLSKLMFLLKKNAVFNKPKVLVLAHEPFVNGASLSLLTILKGLRENFNFLVLIPEAGPLEEVLTEDRINYQIFGLERSGYLEYKNFKDHIIRFYKYNKNREQTLSNLKRLVAKFEPEVIYTNTSTISIGYDLAIITNTPHIWHIREFGDIGLNIGYLPSKNCNAWKMRRSTCCIFTTSILKKHWVNNSINSKVVYNGIDQPTPFRNIKISRTDRIVIGVVGWIVEAKGQHSAVNILAQLSQLNSDFFLHFYGSYNVTCEYYLNLQKLIETNNLQSKVFFKGQVQQAEIYTEIDILLSTGYNEGFGRAIVEAMSCGIPVVARNSGGPSELLENNFDGFLFDSEELAVSSIHKLINDKNLVAEITHNAFNSWKCKFSTYSYLNSINEIFMSILK